MVHNLSFVFNNFWNMHVTDKTSQGDPSWVLVMQPMASTIFRGVGSRAALGLLQPTQGWAQRGPRGSHPGSPSGCQPTLGRSRAADASR